MPDNQLDTNPSPVTFSRRLTQLYTMNQTTRDHFAAYLGVSPQMVSQYLNGRSAPSHTILIKIADYFNVSIDYLLGRTLNPLLDTPADKLLSLAPKTTFRISNMDSDQIRILERFVGNPHFTELIDSIKQIRSAVTAENMHQTFHKEDDEDNENGDTHISDQALYNELIEKHPELAGRLCVISGTEAINLRRKKLEEQFNLIVDIITYWNLDKRGL